MLLLLTTSRFAVLVGFLWMIFETTNGCYHDFSADKDIYQINFCDEINVPELADMSHITKIFAIMNDLYVLEDSFVQSEYILDIELKGNEIFKISVNAFKGLKNLKRLDLSANILEEIAPGTFDHLMDLKDLDLSGNEISTINKDLFKQNPRLEIINFSDNKIKAINASDFENLKSLKKCGWWEIH